MKKQTISTHSQEDYIEIEENNVTFELLKRLNKNDRDM